MHSHTKYFVHIMFVSLGQIVIEGITDEGLL